MNASTPIRMKKLLLAFLLIANLGYGQCLSGAYTIGGATPNYATIGAAVTALTANGVCGPVVFNIRSGTYAEQVSIAPVTGSSAVNTITFQSEALDSTAVVVQATGTASNNYVIRFNGVDYVRFYKIKAKALGVLYTTVVSITNNSDNNEIRSCIIESPVSATSGTNKYQINTLTNDNQNYVFSRNYFTGGSRALYYDGGAPPNALLVTENYCTSQYEMGMFLFGANGAVVKNNTFNYPAAITSFALQVASCNDSAFVSNNKITLGGGGSGFSFAASTGSATKKLLVSNNIISGTGNVNGISITNTSEILVVHNTVIASGTSNTYCFLGQNSNPTVVVKNNIFYQKGTGTCLVYNVGTIGMFTANQNAVYSAATNFGFFYTTTYPSFATWKAATGTDPLSIYSIPSFVSATNFHVASDFSSNLVLPYYPEVSTDYDGVSRDVTSPYFGAYEYFNVPTPVDASINVFTDLPALTCLGTKPVKALLRNYGTSPLTSATINWTINGVAQTPFSWTGSLNFYDTTSVTIGNLNYASLGTYVVRSWTSNPNGTTDGYTPNDTATSATLNTQMSGIYTVGGASPDFTTLALAQTALTTRGMCGSVTLNIRAGTYTAGMTLAPIAGSSAVNTLTLQSESGINASVTVGNPGASTFTINGADNLIIRNMTIGNTSATFSGISVTGGSNNIEISNCILTPNNFQYPLYFSPATANCSNIRVLGNTLNASNYGMYLQGSGGYRLTNVRIENNTLNASVNGTISLAAIDTLTYLNNTATGKAAAAFTSMTYVTIKNNKFSSTDANALAVQSVSNVLIANNMIAMNGSVSGCSGFFTSLVTNMKFVNNSIYCSNTNAGSFGYNVAASSAGSNNKVWNNAIHNSGAGPAIKIAASCYQSLKRNSYSAVGATLGNYFGTNAATFSNWQAIATQDTSSINANPLFNSTTDLHAHEILLKNAGQDVTSIISDDYDAQPRDATPDIGCDEFVPYSIDGGINAFNYGTRLCAGVTPVQVYLKNNGTTTLTSATITYKVNSTTQTPYSWSGSLAAGAQTLVTIGSYNYLPVTAYTLKAWSSNPNGVADPQALNDTITKTFASTALNGNYTIGGTSPDFATIAAATTTLRSGGVCGPVVFNIRNGVYTEQVKIGDIPGTSATNTIKFQSQSLDSSLVTIQYTATSALNYTIAVDTGDYVTFYKLGIKALSSAYSNILVYRTAATHCEVKNCVLTAPVGGSGKLIDFQTGCDTNYVANSKFYYGSNGVTNVGIYSRILNNYFEGQTTSAVNLNGANLELTSNTIISPAAFTGSAIATSGNTTSGYITKNKLTITGSGNATYLYGGSLGSGLIIANNFFSLNGGIGINLAGLGLYNAKIRHNSVYQQGNATCFESQGSTNCLSQNNIFYSTSTSSYVVRMSVGNTGFSSNYNCISSTSNLLVNDNSTYHTSLATYTGATGFEANSISSDPGFTSFANLHVNTPALNGTALYSATVPDDIDGDVRNVSTPDIGADEFTPVIIANDAQLFQLFVESPANCGGTKILYAKIKNIGADTLHSLQLTTTYRGVTYPTYTWTGNLPQGSTQDSVAIATITGMYGTSTIKSWTNLPNGMPDANHANDTLNLVTANIGLTGVYKIGGTTPDFADMRSAFTALKTAGICADVTFDIRPGTYTDTTSIYNIAGTNLYNVKFRSENGDSSSVILQDFPTSAVALNYIVRLGAAKNTSFEKVTFKQNIAGVPTTTNYGLYISNPTAASASNISILNCRFIGCPISLGQVAVENVNNLVNFKALNNYFSNSQSGLKMFSFTNGTFDIGNNVFYQCSEENIRVYSTAGTGTIHDNQFTATTAPTFSSVVRVTTGACIIERNTFMIKYRTVLYINNALFTIRNNYIQADSLVNTGFNAAVEIVMGTAGSEFVFNTVKTDIRYNPLYTFWQSSFAATPMVVQNNIFINRGTTGRLMNSTTNSTIDYNRYEGNSALGFGYYNGANYATFAAWKAASGIDTHSQHQTTYLAASPGYVIVGDVDLDGTATPIAGVTTDILNNPRNATNPDIGAYEGDLLAADAGVKRMALTSADLCAGTDSVKVVLRNYGSAALTNVAVNWKVNAVAQPVYNYSGSIASGDSATVSLGTYNFIGGRRYSFDFYTTNPNGSADLSNLNDTTRRYNVKTRLDGIYTIGGATPDYTTFKQAADSLQMFGVCGPVTFNMRNGTYNSNFNFNVITGSSPVNVVTFQSEAQDSSLVIIADNGTSIGLNQTQNLHFNKLSFVQNSGMNYPTISGSFSSCKNISISNCSFTKPAGSGGLYGTINMEFRDSLSGDFTLKNCVFGVNTNLVLTSNSSFPYTRNIVITNNDFNSIEESFLSNLDDYEFSHNRCKGKFGISNGKRGLQVNDNEMTNCDLVLSAGTAVFPKNIFNNVIKNGRLMVTANSAMNIYHNTVTYTDLGPNFSAYGTAFSLGGLISNVKVRNNIFRVTGWHNAIGILDASIISGTTAQIFDNNDVYSPSDTLVYSFYAPYHINKVQWQNNFNQDQHSVFFEPQFTSVSNLRPLNDAHINNIGVANAVVTVDHDGVARSVSAPDPGAYEFNVVLVPNDAGIQSYTASYCGSGSNPVTVSLKNYGSNTLTSAQIHWEHDGVSQTTYNWTGSLAPDSVELVSIGTFAPSLTSSNGLLFYTLLPNASTDGNAMNDSLSVGGIASSLSGTYTVGGVGADFASYFDVVEALQNSGVCGPVEFVINPGVYPAYLGSSSVFNNITGNTAVNTITFRSATGNASTTTIDLANGSSTGILTLSNVTGVTFKNLSFTGTVTLGVNANKVSFIGNRFNATAPSSFTPTNIINSNQYQQDVQFINNYFTGAGIIFYYNHTSGGPYPKHLTIKGNTFDQAYDGVEINNVDSIVIDSNYFYRTATAVANSHAIRIVSPKNHFDVLRNFIKGDFEKGIEIGIRSAASNLRSPIIANNVIIGNTNSMYNGIITYCDSLNISYNSVSVSNANIPLALSSGRDKVFNNILVTQTGKAMTRTVFASNLQANNNVFYTSGPIVLNNDMANYGTVTAYNAATGLDANSSFVDPQFASAFSDLHYLNSALDGTAIPIAAITIDQQNHARHLTTPNPGAYETPADTVNDAINKFLVLTQIVNDTLLLGNNAISAVVLYTAPPLVDTNTYHYTGTIDSLRIHYKINALPEVTEIWHGSLAFGDSLQYTFSTLLNVPNGKMYNIKVWFENLNPLQSEIDVSDDSLHKTIILPMIGDYTIGGVNPDFTTYRDSYMSYYYCGSVGDVRCWYRPGTYPENITYEENVAYPGHVGTLEYASETHNADDVHVRLNWIQDHVHMKFSNLTITPVALTGMPDAGIHIDAMHITVFDSCKFIGGTPLNERGGLFFKSQSGSVSAIVTNCSFKNMNFAINLSNIESFTSSFSASDFIFENNVIDSCVKGVLIKEYNEGPLGKHVVVRNNIMNTMGTAIEVTGDVVANIDFLNNEIHTTGAGFDFTVPTYHAKLVNNMVNGGLASSFRYTSDLELYNNTFDQQVYMYEQTDSVSLYNNVFYTQAAVPALQVIHATSPVPVFSMDNNNYYAPNNPYFFRMVNNSWPYVEYFFSTIPQIMSAKHTDSSSVHFDPLFLSATDLHSQSSNLKGLARSYGFITDDIDGESRLLNAPDIGADEINLIVTDVWPGDADRTSVVDNFDLLPIGLYYGQTGSPRASINNSWMAFPSMDWGIGQVSGYDIKHVDCNGDGSIDDNDTLAVNLNFSSTHPMMPIPMNDLVRSTAPPMYWLTSSTTYVAGDWVTADLYLGDSSTPIDSLYGIAFNVNYDASLVQTGTENIQYPNSWLATPGTDAITINKTDAPANTAFGGITRIDHTNASGYGKVATYRFQFSNTIAATSNFTLDASAFVAITANGDTVLMNSLPYTVTVNPLGTTITETTQQGGVSIYPNPYVGSTTIMYSIESSSEVDVQVYNAVGQSVQTLAQGIQPAGVYNYNFSAKKLGMDAGVYFVKISIDGKTTMKKIVEIK